MRKNVFTIILVLIPIISLSTAVDLFGPFKPEPTCVCDPLCQTDGRQCEAGRVPRPDCPCCLVCPKAEGEACDNAENPCDKGLECSSPESGVCKEVNTTVCSHEGKKYSTGETFPSSDCDLRCRCMANGGTVCEPLECRPGLKTKGSFSNDPYCRELDVDPINDSCCVLVVCSSAAEEDDSAEVDDYEDEYEEKGNQIPEISTSNSLNVGAELQINRRPLPTSEIEETNIELLQITSSTVQVQFPEVSGGNLMYVEEKNFKGDRDLDKTPISPSGNQFRIQDGTPWENAIILEGNKIFTLTGLQPGTKYRLRWMTPVKRYPDVMVETAKHDKKQPKVIITAKTFDSVTLSFDHFAPEDYTHGYVAIYKSINDSRWSTQDNQAGENDDRGLPFHAELPSVTIEGLRPRTNYMARIAVYDDFRLRSLGKSTGIIEFTTDYGCVYSNRSVAVGAFNEGCDAACVCAKDGRVECGQRCQLPFHRSGTFSADPLCVEQPADDAGCCVIAICANGVEGQDENDFQDHQVSNKNGPCKGIKCGPNAECRHEVFREEGETICFCRDGFLGDPDSEIGCSERLNSGDLEPGVLASEAGCQVKNGTFGIGEEWFDGCEYKCTCSQTLEIICQPRCKPLPEVTEENSSCEIAEDSDDSCCSVMNCPIPADGLEGNFNENPDSDHSPPVGFDGCEYKNATYAKGERFFDGCEQHCICSGYGDTICLARCPPQAPAIGTNCTTLSEPRDPCCNVTVCEPLNTDEAAGLGIQEVLKIVPETDSSYPDSEGRIVNNPPQDKDIEEIPNDHCEYHGQIHELGSEFYDGCEAFCYCGTDTKVTCNPIRCPSSFGMDVVSPYCLKWNDHPDFVPKAPMCCPPVPECLSDGTCDYHGKKFNNYENIPTEMSGCEKRCYCENGQVQCQDACHQLPDKPPGYLACASEIAVKIPQEERPCCSIWACPDISELIPKRLSGIDHTNINDTALRFEVDLPRSLDGVAGYFKVYLSGGLQGHPDPNQWPTVIVSPPRGKLSVNFDDEAEFVLADLLPNHQYFLKIALHLTLPNKENEVIVESEIRSVRTIPVEIKKPEEEVPVASIEPLDVQIRASNVSSTSALIVWRSFDAEEKKFIDGVQIRFTTGLPPGLTSANAAFGVPGTSPFIHRDTNFFELQNLKPDTSYEVDLYLIPMPNSEKEFFPSHGAKFRTLKPTVDPYKFAVDIQTKEIFADMVRLTWNGIPEPHQKFVNLYRIIYTESGSQDPHLNEIETQSVFKVAKIDSTKSATLLNLRPMTKYNVWLEAYLRNGKVLQSNVLQVKTNDKLSEFAMASPSFAGDPSESGGENLESGNYFNSMIIAAIIAGFALLALIIVTAFYLRRTTTYKAIISGGANSGGGNLSKNGSAKNSTLPHSSRQNLPPNGGESSVVVKNNRRSSSNSSSPTSTVMSSVISENNRGSTNGRGHNNNRRTNQNEFEMNGISNSNKNNINGGGNSNGQSGKRPVPLPR